MHIVSKKDLNSAELETKRTSKNPTIVVTANGEVLATEEATVYVRELKMLLENTPSVSVTWKTLRRIGYSYHWTSGQKTHLIKNGKTIHCDTSNHEPLVVPGLSTSSSTSSTSPTYSSQETVTVTEIPATRGSESTSEESSARRDPLHTTKNNRVMNCKVCRIDHRSSSMDWLMKVFQNIEILPVPLMNYLWSRER